MGHACGSIIWKRPRPIHSTLAQSVKPLLRLWTFASEGTSCLCAFPCSPQAPSARYASYCNLSGPRLNPLQPQAAGRREVRYRQPASTPSPLRRPVAETLHCSATASGSQRKHVKSKRNLTRSTELMQHAIQRVGFRRPGRHGGFPHGTIGTLPHTKCRKGPDCVESALGQNIPCGWHGWLSTLSSVSLECCPWVLDYRWQPRTDERTPAGVGRQTNGDGTRNTCSCSTITERGLPIGRRPPSATRVRITYPNGAGLAPPC